MIENATVKFAQKDDLEDIYNLSNDPDVRKDSFNTAPILFEDHVQWFNSKINDDNCIFYVIRDLNGALIGEARFDRDSEIYVISVSLDKNFRGKGFSSEIIAYTSDKVLSLKKSRIVAYVKENNIASFKSFQKAGYMVLTRETMKGYNCYKLEYDPVQNAEYVCQEQDND